MLCTCIFFLAITGFISYTYYDNIYFKCDIYNCTYTQTNQGCNIEVDGLNFYCSQWPCKRNFSANLTKFTSSCFMPLDRKVCPMVRCHTQQYIYEMLITIGITLLDIFLIYLCIYHCINFYIHIRKNRCTYGKIDSEF